MLLGFWISDLALVGFGLELCLRIPRPLELMPLPTVFTMPWIRPQSYKSEPLP
jgi:hypothetical protein